MFSRAPSMAFTENSASAPAIATVFGFGLSFAAVAKKPSEKAGFGSGPFGWIWK